MIKGIGHSAVKVVDMEKSLQFYCDKIGLKKAFEINDDQNRPWIVYLKIADGQFLELFYGGESDPANKYSGDLIGYHHFCIETDDIEGLAERFFKYGFLEKPEPNRGRDLNYSLWIHDPDGNAVEFVQYNADSFHVKSFK
jgi:catechol 2,3-dioxygenase-like lactoylglutathione lyase family enzyme